MKMTNDEEKIMLYYPTIKIEDGTWLRNAILYWDKVSSIVSGMNFDEFNSIEIEYLTASLFCVNDDLQIEDRSAYLFYARENGFISTTRTKREGLR